MKTWNDGRPDNVCQKCGYGTCCCHLQAKYAAKVKRQAVRVVKIPEGLI